MQILKNGDSGQDVAQMQALLNKHGARIAVDGIFGSGTRAAVIAFQEKNSLAPDGVVGRKTWAALNGAPAPSGGSGFIRKPYPLHTGQYVQQESPKRGVTWHYTVNTHNPYRVVDSWNNDQRGRVGTHFVIGNEWRGDDTHDGEVLQTMSLDYWGFHIAATRTGLSKRESDAINAAYIGVECCALGNLEKIAGKFYSVGKNRKIHVPDEAVAVLDKPFRTYEFWHKLSSKQIQALEDLTFQIIERYTLQMERRTFDASWFDLSWQALRRRTRAVTAHTNFEWGKFDLFPQKEILLMLERLAERCAKSGLLK